MANVFDTAAYILKLCGKTSPVKLQKLCYYAQAWAMVWDDKPLFDEEFSAWATGPVCCELQNAIQGVNTVAARDVTGDVGNLTESQKDTICHVVKDYGAHDARWLGQLTMMEAPWKDARKGLPAGAGRDCVISKESIGWYYSGL